MRYNIVLIAAGLFCSVIAGAQARIEKNGEKYLLNVDGKTMYVNGVGGTYDLATAAANGANSCRTWGGSIQQVHETVELARKNGIYIMQGIGLPKDLKFYQDPEFRASTMEQCKALAREFKGEKSIIIWGIGNEIDHEERGNYPEVWQFVNEIAREMRAINPDHLYSTVISYNKKAMDLIGEYAPDLDLLGINCYGDIESLGRTVRESKYNGPYLVTEWGPTGWWEIAQTEWEAPIEQTSEEKRQVYESRFNIIAQDPACMGSYCFLWGQKEERTPTWFCMFVEKNVPGLPLNAEKTPMVEAMQRVWTGVEPEQTAPVIKSLKAGGKLPSQNATFAAGKRVKLSLDVYDREKDIKSYVWEVLYEATVTATGGAWEPRPERVGAVVISTKPSLVTTFDKPGNYRVYVYVLDESGFASTANIPVRIK